MSVQNLKGLYLEFENLFELLKCFGPWVDGSETEQLFLFKLFYEIAHVTDILILSLFLGTDSVPLLPGLFPLDNVDVESIENSPKLLLHDIVQIHEVLGYNSGILDWIFELFPSFLTGPEGEDLDSLVGQIILPSVDLGDNLRS